MTAAATAVEDIVAVNMRRVVNTPSLGWEYGHRDIVVETMPGHPQSMVFLGRDRRFEEFFVLYRYRWISRAPLLCTAVIFFVCCLSHRNAS